MQHSLPGLLGFIFWPRRYYCLFLPSWVSSRILLLVCAFMTVTNDLEQVTSFLHAGRRPAAVQSFGPLQLEKSLAVPKSRTLERHNFLALTILNFLLMNLRTAMDREWLQSLPALYKVIFFYSCTLFPPALHFLLKVNFVIVCLILCSRRLCS